MFKSARVVRRALRMLLGSWEWQAPPWGRWLAARSRALAATTTSRARLQPAATAGVLLGTLVLVAGALGAWRWYVHRPTPEYASYAVAAPGRTRLEDESAKPEPLIVRFDSSVAALALADKELPTGVSMQPALAGTWRWDGDRSLEFRVQGDWPVGQRYTVKLTKAIFGPQTRLAAYEFTFSSAAFEAQMTGVQLYQDPIDPGLKQGVFDIHFTHPVDPSTFEHQIELRLAGQTEGLLGVGRQTTPFTVVYDKLRLNASVHSQALPIPKDPTELRLQIGTGLAAARGGNRTTAPLTAVLRVPGLYSLAATNLDASMVDNDRNEPEQVLSLDLSAATGERDVARAVSAWVLPTVRPAQGFTPAAGSDATPYAWGGVNDVTDDVLSHSQQLRLEPIAAEREFVENHAFRYRADVGRYVMIQIAKNLRSFGGYLLPATARFIVQVPPFPPGLKILAQGSLLALSGERKVVVLVRDLPGVEVSIGRVLPDQIQHLVSQSDGDFANPSFAGNFGPDNLVERFQRKIPLANLTHGQAHYEPIDLGRYLEADGTDKRGLFLLTVRGYDPKLHDDANPSGLVEQRLVLVTDLGLLVKRSTDGTQDVFVQSIQTGLPVGGATVEIIAKNGSTLFSQDTDGEGRAHFARLDGLTHERAALLVRVKKGSDSSFLPLNRADRSLDYSRFDVGGIRNARNANQIGAYLFSDRGVYRPGDTIHVGMIAKTANWSRGLLGIPLESEVLDARGLTVKRERFKLAAGGFAELSYTSATTSPTGAYTVNLYIVKDDRPGALLGTTSVRVQEFEPDRMKVAAHLSAESADGWVSPKALQALVNVRNLFGTAAEHRRVEASLTLTPAYPSFRSLPDYRFYDPLRARDGYNEKLQDATTDAGGNATFDLGLQKYARATYRVHLLARAFEPDSGRSVAADAATLVSDLPFLIGFKTDGSLEYVSRAAARSVSLVAIDPTAKRTIASGLKLARVETRYVSVLTKQTNGTYKYESRKKETSLSERAFTIATAGTELRLDTDTPGTFAYVIRDGAGLELNRVEYTVAGQGNVSRSLERNAELQITLDKTDYAPGAEIQLSIKAPYLGAGLITIERDHVYATHWFKTDTTASVQTIRIPADFEGNGYVSVQFIRDPGSDEIFTSPLSYGVVPFATSLAQRTNPLTLEVPAAVKPGEVLRMKLAAARPARAVLFAVDEGILQVAHYQAPDPLTEFFKKRALEVNTAQILDLILPEFKRIMAAAAPGGDGEAALRRNLNPFKRKHDQPAVYWSGIVDLQHDHEFSWTVPDTFNGSLKVFALAVDDTSIGIAQGSVMSRGDFVLTPNMPSAVAPGDEFEVSVGVTNAVVGSGTAGIQVEAEPPPQLEAIGALRQTLQIDAMHEGVAVFHFSARAQLGAAPVVFKAAWQTHAARLAAAVSVRPASPYVTDLLAGHFSTGADVALPRALYPDFRKLKVGVSALPLVLVDGLADYLDDYPHLCTEQLVSRGFPSLVLERRPELANSAIPRPTAGAAAAALIDVLRARQNAEGGFGLWSASVETDEFASVYAVHWMLEAREQGVAIPEDLLQRALVWLQRYAASPVDDAETSFGLPSLRTRAYATYLLTRQGTVTTPLIAGLRESLDTRFAHDWKDDVTAAYLAAAYQLQKQDREAAPLIDHAAARIGKPDVPRFSDYYDGTIRDAQVLYLLSRHFPARARALAPSALEALVTPLGRGEYNTLSAAFLVLGFDAYAANVPADTLAKFTVAESLAGGKATPLALQGQLILRGSYAADARSLHLGNDSGLAGYYAVTNAGFDRAPPTGVLQQGLEILREYLDSGGHPVKVVQTGDEITVRLRLRATASDFVPNVAVTDLLPGGFERVSSTEPAGAPPPNTWRPEFVDLRDDRVVLYGSLGTTLAEYTYRIRATNAGTFLIPAIYAESMYDRKLRARGVPGSIRVERPGKS